MAEVPCQTLLPLPNALPIKTEFQRKKRVNHCTLPLTFIHYVNEMTRSNEVMSANEHQMNVLASKRIAFIHFQSCLFTLQTSFNFFILDFFLILIFIFTAWWRKRGCSYFIIIIEVSHKKPSRELKTFLYTDICNICSHKEITLLHSDDSVNSYLQTPNKQNSCVNSPILSRTWLFL